MSEQDWYDDENIPQEDREHLQGLKDKMHKVFDYHVKHGMQTYTLWKVVRLALNTVEWIEYNEERDLEELEEK